jgi:hypothetical protein
MKRPDDRCSNALYLFNSQELFVDPVQVNDVRVQAVDVLNRRRGQKIDGKRFRPFGFWIQSLGQFGQPAAQLCPQAAGGARLPLDIPLIQLRFSHEHARMYPQSSQCTVQAVRGRPGTTRQIAGDMKYLHQISGCKGEN